MNPRVKHGAGSMKPAQKEQPFFFEKKKQKTFVLFAGGEASL
jgi:hypothetical protein